MKIENLSKSELLKMIDSFEHYPAVTDKDDRAYILAYLDDEACSISDSDVEEYLVSIVITKYNIADYYEFMSYKDKEEYNCILKPIFKERFAKLLKIFFDKEEGNTINKYTLIDTNYDHSLYL